MLKTLKRLIKLFTIINDHRNILLALFLLLVLVILNEVTIYHIGLITGDYYKVLNDKDKSGFFHQTWKSLGLIFGSYSLVLFFFLFGDYFRRIIVLKSLDLGL